MCARRGWKNSGESKAIRAAAGDDDRRVHTQGEGERPRELARAGRESRGGGGYFFLSEIGCEGYSRCVCGAIGVVREREREFKAGR